jgi:signal transduction histidine kinase
MGLAICRGIVEAHGGQINAETPDEGPGICFVFTLPRMPDPRNVGAVDMLDMGG